MTFRNLAVRESFLILCRRFPVLRRDTVASWVLYPEVSCQHGLIICVPMWIKICCFQGLKVIQTFLSCVWAKRVNSLNIFWHLSKPCWLSLHHAFCLNSVWGKHRSGTLEQLSRTDCLRSGMSRRYVLVTALLLIFSLSFSSIGSTMNHQHWVLFRICRILCLFMVLDACELGLKLFSCYLELRSLLMLCHGTL